MPSLHGGGAEYVARTWMAWLASQGHEVSAVLTGRPVDPAFVPEGVEVHSVASRRGQIAKLRALRRVLLESRPDVALSLQMHANLMLINAARSLPGAQRPRVVISERNLVTLGLPSARLSHRVKVLAAKRQYRAADMTIAISHPVAAELVAAFRIGGDRVVVVPNPATAKVQSTPSRPVAVSQDSTSASAGDSRVLTLALPCRLVGQKRPELALETAAELTRRGWHTNVVSFGGGPLLEQMLSHAARLGVDFHQRGWVEDWLAELDPLSTTILLPSAREGFGNVLVEAAAAGLPSVAVSGALGVADAIVPGISGELSLTESPSDLADAVLAARQISMTNIEPWLQHFSVDASGRKLERVLQAVARASL
ncbi:glycosyltransferase [Modestobacter sp. SYSU DS0511]